MKGHVFKRGKTWTYIFDIEPNPLTGDRRQRTKGGWSSEDEAWSECRKAMVEYEKGTAVAPSKMTVEQFFTEWFERIEPAVAETTFASYRNYARAYVIPYIGGQPLQKVSSKTVDELYRHLLANGRVRAQKAKRAAIDARQAAREQKRKDKAAGKKSRGPAPKADGTRTAKPVPPPGLGRKTVVSVHTMLRAAFGDAKAWHYIGENPAATANVPRVPRNQRTQRPVWSIPQLQLFLKAAKGERFFALWVMELATGLRRGELAGVTRKSLNLEEKTFTMFKTRTVANGKVVETEEGKTENAERLIALDDYTVEVLRQHLEMIDKEKAEFGDAYDKRDYIFCWPDGAPPNPQTFTRQFNRIAKDAGLPPIHLHDARHSYVTAGRKARIDWKALSVRVGHATAEFTMDAYLTTDLEADREVANAIAALIFGADGSDLGPEVLGGSTVIN